jgi:hypothetical protein
MELGITENERTGSDHRSVVQRCSTLQGITAETKIQRLGHELLYQATLSRQKVIGLNAEQECCITTHILVGDMPRSECRFRPGAGVGREHRRFYSARVEEA